MTEFYQKGALETVRLARLLGAEAAVFKARSPSCGCGARYDGSFTHTVIPENGMTAEALLSLGLPVYTESTYFNLFQEGKNPMMDELCHAFGKTTGRHVFCKTLHAGKFLPGNRPFFAHDWKQF